MKHKSSSYDYFLDYRQINSWKITYIHSFQNYCWQEATADDDEEEGGEYGDEEYDE